MDRTTKYAFARLVRKATGAAARAFPDELVAAVPHQVHTVPTDNGIQFADLPKNRNGPTASWRGHPFDRAWQEHGIEHRLTKPNHPWTNGQIERMNRTLKDATVRRYHYETHRQLEEAMGGRARLLQDRSPPLDIGTEHPRGAGHEVSCIPLHSRNTLFRPMS